MLQYLLHIKMVKSIITEIVVYEMQVGIIMLQIGLIMIIIFLEKKPQKL